VYAPFFSAASAGTAAAVGGLSAVTTATIVLASAVQIALYINDCAHNVQQANTANNYAVQHVEVGQTGTSSYHSSASYTPNPMQYEAPDPRGESNADMGGCSIGEDLIDGYEAGEISNTEPSDGFQAYWNPYTQEYDYTWTSNRGGNKTDYINYFGGPLNNTGTTMENHGGMYGHGGSRPAHSGPGGWEPMYFPATGACTAVDDPFTSGEVAFAYQGIKGLWRLSTNIGPIANFTVSSIRTIYRNRVPIGKLANHIFSGKVTQKYAGAFKFVDTPANRALIDDIVNDYNNFMGIDSYGKQYFSKILPDGTTAWAYVQDGLVKGAGWNELGVQFILPQ
jgi:hypothetical protein